MLQPTIRLVIELDARSEPITGTLLQPDGQVKPFHGWLALTEALESSRRAASDDRTAQNPRTSSLAQP